MKGYDLINTDNSLKVVINLMGDYKDLGLHQIDTHGKKNRPDSMGQFLNCINDMGIDYNGYWLNKPQLNSYASAELNKIFNNLESKRGEIMTSAEQTFFISHSTRQKELVKIISDFINAILVRSDLNVFCTSDDDSLKSGQKYHDEIDKHITDSNGALILFSEDYMASEYCLLESGYLYFNSNISERKVLYYAYPGFDFKDSLLSSIFQFGSMSNQKSDLHKFLYDIKNTIESIVGPQHIQNGKKLHNTIDEFNGRLDEQLLKESDKL